MTSATILAFSPAPDAATWPTRRDLNAILGTAARVSAGHWGVVVEPGNGCNVVYIGDQSGGGSEADAYAVHLQAGTGRIELCDLEDPENLVGTFPTLGEALGHLEQHAAA